VTLLAKMEISESQRYPLNLRLRPYRTVVGDFINIMKTFYFNLNFKKTFKQREYTKKETTRSCKIKSFSLITCKLVIRKILLTIIAYIKFCLHYINMIAYHRKKRVWLLAVVSIKNVSICLFLIFVTETISRTDKGQPRPKYIFNKFRTKIYFFLLYRGLVHHHHRILNIYFLWRIDKNKYVLLNFYKLFYVKYSVVSSYTAVLRSNKSVYITT